MKLRVGLGRRLEYEGTAYYSGDELDVSDENAAAFLRTGLVVPADGVWPADLLTAPSEPPRAAPAEYEKPLRAPGPAKPPRKHKSRAGSICAHPRCPEWVPDGGKCPAHKRVSSVTGKPYQSSQRNVPAGRRTRWAALSRAYLRTHEYCEGERCAEVNPLTRNRATEVHHLDSLGLAGPRWNDESNWLPVCKACHSVYTGRDFGFGR